MARTPFATWLVCLCVLSLLLHWGSADDQSTPPKEPQADGLSESAKESQAVIKATLHELAAINRHILQRREAFRPSQSDTLDDAVADAQRLHTELIAYLAAYQRYSATLDAFTEGITRQLFFHMQRVQRGRSTNSSNATPM